jgi:hypothetical protein
MNSRGKTHLKPNWLVWDVDRADRTFRVYVAEPRTMAPKDHPSIFRAALGLFLPSADPTEVGTADKVHVHAIPRTPSRFDLLTFPEAFLPLNALLDVLKEIASARLPIGCVHTGLRPAGPEENGNHLLPVESLRRLVEDLRSIPNLAQSDLAPFHHWLSQQQRDWLFNIASLFTVDARGELRICLHPKLVKSKFEANPEHDRDMKEADLLTLITLMPTEDEYMPITIQPVICSDVLNLSTDHPNNHPLEAITSQRSCFDRTHSDHVDVVSVATCTPNATTSPDSSQLEWHRKFRDSFERSASEDPRRRHQFAAFILSNFRFLSKPPNNPGGLSGIFMPWPIFDTNPFQDYISKPRSIRCYAPNRKEADRSAEEDRWEHADATGCKDSVLGYIIALDPDISREPVATLFGFTIRRLPRDANRWQRVDALCNYSVYCAAPATGESETQIQFKPVKVRGKS